MYFDATIATSSGSIPVLPAHSRTASATSLSNGSGAAFYTTKVGNKPLTTWVKELLAGQSSNICP
jgi:hypothetical protein